MAKIIKVTKEDIANIVKNVLKESHDNLVEPYYLHFSAEGRSFVVIAYYKLEEDGDTINVFYKSDTNEITMEVDDEHEGVGINAFDEHMLAIVKADFIKRFRITEKGIGMDFSMGGEVYGTNHKSGFPNWKANRV